MLILDIGCGDRKVYGAIGLDCRRTKAVDVIADAIRLPFKSESFDRICSIHTIEHFSHREVQYVINEWVRVLKREGTIEIRCPWLRMRAFLFFLNPTRENIQHIYGGQVHERSYHKCGFSFGLLKDLLRSAGIVKIKRVFEKGPMGLPYYADLHVTGIKKK